MSLLSKDTTNLKKFIYNELYNSRSQFFVDMSSTRPSKEDTINAIHDAGGIASLAHPGRYKQEFDVESEIENGTLLDGLDSVEVFYPIHSETFRQYLLEKCRERGLRASGGSDDHLAPKDGIEYKMGTVNLPDIPETAWVKDFIKSGRDYLVQASKEKDFGKRLLNILNYEVPKKDSIEEGNKEER